MTTSAAPYRDLSVHTSPDFQRGLPVNPTHWSLAELDDWKAHLLTRRWVDADRLQVQWDRMLEARQARLDIEVPYRGNTLPPAEVVQELPLEMLAGRAYVRAPQVPLLGHHLAGLLEEMTTAPGKASAAAGRRIAVMLGAWGPGRRMRWGTSYRSRDGGPACGVGGLKVQVRDVHIEVHFGQTLVCCAPAHEGQLPRLRRLASLWARLVRGAVASGLRLGVPCGPSLGTPLELVLPALAAGDYRNAFVITGRRLDRTRRTVLEDSNFFADGAARHALAGQLLLRGAGNAEFEACVQRHIEWIFDGLPTRRLRPCELPASEALSRTDGESRTFITAYRDGSRVPLGARAQYYRVLLTIPEGEDSCVRVTSLALAIDLDRTNRVAPRRLALATAA